MKYMEIRHCLGIERVGHNAGTPAQDDPGEHGSDQGIADTDPGRGNTVFPAKLSGVTDEYDRREIRSTE